MEQMMDMISGDMDEHMMQLAVQEGDRLVAEFRNAWLAAFERMQVVNITVMWKASLGRLPKKEEIQAIMSYAARATVAEWVAAGRYNASPGISSALMKAGTEADDRYEKLREAEGKLAATAPLGEQRAPTSPAQQSTSARDTSTQEPERKRRKVKVSGKVKASGKSKL
jgi:hypothetical protein